MKNKIILLSVLVIVMISACHKNENCVWYQGTTGITNSILEFSSSSTPNLINASDTINSDELMIHIGFTLQDITTHLECYGNSNPSTEIADEISRFTISTVNVFNQQYQAGDTMNGCFELYRTIYIDSHGGFYDFEDVSSLIEYTSTFPVQSEGGFYLLMKSSTDSIRAVQFNINYRETDGTEFSCTTPVVFLRP